MYKIPYYLNQHVSRIHTSPLLSFPIPSQFSPIILPVIKHKFIDSRHGGTTKITYFLYKLVIHIHIHIHIYTYIYIYIYIYREREREKKKSSNENSIFIVNVSTTKIAPRGIFILNIMHSE